MIYVNSVYLELKIRLLILRSPRHRPLSVRSSTSSSREGDDVRLDILCAQLNLGKSGTSRDWFNFHPSKIQLLQEPPCRGGGVAMKHSNFNLYFTKGGGDVSPGQRYEFHVD